MYLANKGVVKRLSTGYNKNFDRYIRDEKKDRAEPVEDQDENELIVKTREDIIEMTNGCICCSINGELLDTIDKVLKNNQDKDVRYTATVSYLSASSATTSTVTWSSWKSP